MCSALIDVLPNLVAPPNQPIHCQFFIGRAGWDIPVGGEEMPVAAVSADGKFDVSWFIVAGVPPDKGQIDIGCPGIFYSAASVDAAVFCCSKSDWSFSGNSGERPTFEIRFRKCFERPGF